MNTMDSIAQNDSHHHGNQLVIMQRNHSNQSHRDNTNQNSSDHSVHNMHHNMQMHMYMYFNTETFIFLRKSWSSISLHGLVTALVVTAVLAILLEVVKSYLYYQELRVIMVSSPARSRTWYMILLRTCHTGLYCSRVVTGYVLMLTVMTFNVWLVTCAVIGSAIGYFSVQPFLNFYFRDMCLQKHATSNKEENGRLVEDTGGEDVREKSDVTFMEDSQQESIDCLTSFIEEEKL